MYYNKYLLGKLRQLLFVMLLELVLLRYNMIIQFQYLV